MSAVEIVENPSYYAWSVYVDGTYAGMITKGRGGGYACPRGGVDSDRRFRTVDAAANALRDAMDDDGGQE